jgi:hypothetical protein
MRIRKSLSREDQMFALISAQATSGESIKGYCERHGISQGNWFYWKKKYQRQYQDKGGFAVVEITDAIEVDSNGDIFAEYKGIKLFQPVSATYLKELIA